MSVLLQKIGFAHTLFAKTGLKTNVGILEASLFDTNNTGTNRFKSTLQVKLNGDVLFFFQLDGLDNRTTVVSATFAKRLIGISSARLRFAHQNTRTIVSGKVNERSIRPFTVRCRCKGNACGCEQPDQIRLAQGGTISIRINESLNRAVNLLLRKLFKEILTEAGRKQAAAKEGCIGACVASFSRCSSSCLCNPLRFLTCFENCQRIKRNCLFACEKALG